MSHHDPAGSEPAESLSPSMARLTEIVTQIAALIETRGHLQSAESIRRELGGTRHSGSAVVVAGETAAGKSRLINALLGRPMLDPVGAAETTGCPIVFRYGTNERAAIDGLNPTTGQRESAVVTLEQLAKHVSSRSPHPALLVQATVDAPVLIGLDLIDTPGIGGVGSGFRELALAMGRDADAVVFVHAADAPLLAPQLQFLLQAASTVPMVIVAATKTDLYPDFEETVNHIRHTLDRNQLLHGVPILPLSVEHFERALAAGRHSTTSETYRRLSGVSELAALLCSSVAERAAELKWARLARRTTTAAADIIRATRLATEHSSGQLGALDEELRHLTGLLENEATNRIAVNHLLQRMRSEPRVTLEAGTRTARQEFRNQAAGGPKSTLPQLPVHVEGALAAAATRALIEQDELIEKLQNLIDSRFFVPASGSVIRNALGEDTTLELDLPEPGEPPKVRGQMIFAVASGLGIGRLAVVAAAEVLGGPFGWALGGFVGGGVIGGMLWKQGQVGDHQLRQHLVGWVERASNDAVRSGSQEIDHRAQLIQHQVEDELPQRAKLIRERHRELTTQKAQIGANSRKPLAGLTELQELAAQCENLAEQLTSPHLAGENSQ